ncbi:hypothetical protein HYX12_02270 [Candidatus Woesearchaeota archaeon]|nr:hypothetical protein [Candidatus Woesearchaeota archaeon]
MIITLCGSLEFIQQMNEVAAHLQKEGHTVLLPDSAAHGWDKQYWNDIKEKDPVRFSKIKAERMKMHFNKIDQAEAILILNYDKNKKKNYIGPNTFLEMGYAFSRNKRIYLLNGIPQSDLQEEVDGMQPIIINNNLKNIEEKMIY